MSSNSDTTIISLLNKIQTDILDPTINILFVVATIIFFWGIITYVIGTQGDEAKLKLGKKVMLWGIIGLTIMASAWGIVNVICNFIGDKCL